jgi:hypothetical protein
LADQDGGLRSRHELIARDTGEMNVNRVARFGGPDVLVIPGEAVPVERFCSK